MLDGWTFVHPHSSFSIKYLLLDHGSTNGFLFSEYVQHLNITSPLPPPQSPNICFLHSFSDFHHSSLHHHMEAVHLHGLRIKDYLARMWYYFRLIPKPFALNKIIQIQPPPLTFWAWIWRPTTQIPKKFKIFKEE